ncbi:TetR/AcrR family transcriptional regulator [Ralstonia mojiangensis]|uniref:TetR/AcrR family transcriptional regulator n=1 Tax=Ralstonia mojiangensis TaxID=2953895 RepID=UPI00209067B0|nr:TetR/AcrR family transcriptional regulator [Ralstonia mojiangensis]MCO5413345.1 TetR/AcrR family transcriptional regulator [Ralstonia mojiangensis]
MPRTPTSRAAKAVKSATAAAAATSAATAVEEKEPRGARRKRETRSRLLEAALKLMAEKGMEGVAINEITEAADVGFGSFYNHFESKEAIYLALTDWVFEEFADTLDRIAEGLADPAEVIAVSVRHTLLRARREPVWGQFLIREGFSPRILSRGLGQRLLRDIGRGVAAGRFDAPDPLMSLISVGGTVLAAVAVGVQIDAQTEPAATLLNGLADSKSDFPERAASALLRMLGLDHAEAEDIAHRPLPEMRGDPEAL